MSIDKDFVPYTESLELKELGFDEPCFVYWNFYTNEVNFNEQPSKFSSEDVIQLPTFSQAFRFFREKYGLPSWIYTSNNKEYWYSVLKDGRMLIRDYKPFETYEEAELACLRKLIEIVKQKS